MTTIPDGPRMATDSKERKGTPVTTGVLDYFPLAIAAISRLSKAGNDKHNPGQPMHWAREKSTDHADCIGRHLIERGTVEPESGELHDVCLAWRALANLQLAEEARLRNTTVVDPQIRLFEYPAKKPDTTIGVAWEAPQANKPFVKSHADKRADVANGCAMPPPNLPGSGRVKQKFTFWYVATPYTRFPAGHLAAFHMASRLSAWLMSLGVPVFSPIAHSHPIAGWMKVEDVTDHDLWMKMDGPLMEAASGMIVITAESWEESKGMAEEIKRFTAAGKPVVYWNPGSSIPEEVLKTAKA